MSKRVNTSAKKHTLSSHPIYLRDCASVWRNAACTFHIRAIAQPSVTNNDDFFTMNVSLCRELVCSCLAGNFARVISMISFHDAKLPRIPRAGSFDVSAFHQSIRYEREERETEYSTSAQERFRNFKIIAILFVRIK